MNEYGVPLWSTETYSHFSDNAGALVWANYINQNYLTEFQTMSSAWHLAGAFYPTVPFWNRGMVLANTPWSGEWVAQPNVEVTAHTTQFTQREKSWYLAIGSGSGLLESGGSFVSFVDPVRPGVLTIVIEKGYTGIGDYGGTTAAEEVRFVLRGELATLKTLGLWRTHLSLGGAHAKPTVLLANEGPVADLPLWMARWR